MSDGRTVVFTIEGAEPVRLDLRIAEALGISRTQAATLIAEGRTSVHGRRERASYRPVPGETVTVVLPPAPQREILPEQVDLSVVYEDESLLVVDKPAGMVVHPAPGHWSGTLVNALLGRGDVNAPDGDETRAGIVHRLDKETSGLLLVAKTERAHRLLSAAIAARRVARRYVVMAWGHLDEDVVTVNKPIARHPRDRKRMAVVEHGRAARTDFIRIARFASGDLLRAKLYSGRTHQIRVHLSSIGHPVMGDDVYGGGGGRRLVGLEPKRHFLHAAWLRLRHPITGEHLDFRAPLPPDLRHSLAVIASDPSLEADPDLLSRFGFFEGDRPDAPPGGHDARGE